MYQIIYEALIREYFIEKKNFWGQWKQVWITRPEEEQIRFDLPAQYPLIASTEKEAEAYLKYHLMEVYANHYRVGERFDTYFIEKKTFWEWSVVWNKEHTVPLFSNTEEGFLEDHLYEEYVV